MFPVIHGILNFSEDSSPALLCPYVMQNNTFSSYSFVDGVAQGDTGATLLDTLTIAPDNGKIAIECELVSGTGVSATVSNSTDSAVVTADASGTSATSGAFSTTDSVAASNGDRVGIIIDTDTGVVDYVNEQWHENFAEAVQVDVTNGAGFVLSGTGTVKAYTKAADMQLPYPAGTTDTCLTGGLRELVTYPLDASEAELQGIGYAGRLENPSLAQQQGGYTIPDGNGNPSAFYGMFPSLTGIVPLDLSSGDIAVEFDLSPGGSFTPDGAGSLLLANFKAWVVRLSDQQELLAVNMTRQQDSSATALFDVMGSTQGSSSLDPDENHRVGFLFENSTGKFRVWLNSTEATLTDDTLPDLSAVVLAFLLTSSSADDNGAAGTTMTTRLITDPYWFTTPFPPGSVAIDGVTPVTFTPLSLFATTDGFWGDSTDGATLFESTAGIDPAVAGEFCGLRLDKSGNGNNQYQATSASKPTVAIVDGVQCLQLDDDDDSMTIDVPAGGWAGTFVQGTSQGVIVGEIAAPEGPYQIPTDPNYAGPGTDVHTFIFDRVLDTDELEALVEWVGQRLPVKDFSGVSNTTQWFRNRNDITSLDFSRSDADVESMFRFAAGCENLTSIDVSGLIGPGALRLYGLIEDCTSLTTASLGAADTSGVTDWERFADSSGLVSLDMSDQSTESADNFIRFAFNAPLENLIIYGGTGSPFSDSPCTNYTRAFENTNLSQQSYTDLVTAIEAAGTSNGTLDITGGTSTTTGAAQTAVDALRGRGWTVTTPDGY